MKIKTNSGYETVNKKSAYGKWLQGWIAGGGWSGAFTLSKAYERAVELKENGVSWYMLGKLMASEQEFGRALEAEEWSELYEEEE